MFYFRMLVLALFFFPLLATAQLTPKQIYDNIKEEKGISPSKAVVKFRTDILNFDTVQVDFETAVLFSWLSNSELEFGLRQRLLKYSRSHFLAASDTSNIARLNYRLGLAAYQFNEYDLASSYLKLVFKNSLFLSQAQSSHLFNAKILQSVLYRRTGKMDQAKRILQALEPSTRDNSNLRNRYYQNLSLIYSEQFQLDSFLMIKYEQLKQGEKENDPRMLIYGNIGMANFFFHIQDPIKSN